MTTRARQKTMMSWFPRGFLILTAILAPVIDQHMAPGTRSGATPVEAVETADAVEPVEVAHEAVRRLGIHFC